MAAVTVRSDFGAQENKRCHSFHFSPFYLWWSDGTDAVVLVFLNVEFQDSFFGFPLSLSSRGSLVPFHFLPLLWYHLHIWGCWYFSQWSWFQLGIHPAWHFAWCTLHTWEKLQEMVRNRETWNATVHRGMECQTWFSDWTTPSFCI